MSENTEEQPQVTDEQSFNEALEALQNDGAPAQEAAPEPEKPAEIKEEPKEEPKEDPKATDLYKALTAQDRELRELRKKVKESGNAENYKELAEKDPEAFLDKFGFTFDKLFDIFASKEAPEQQPEANTQESQLAKRLEVLEKMLAEQREQGKRSEAQAIYEKNLSALYSKATSDLERWHFVNKAQDRGSLNLAYKVAGHIYEQTGEHPKFDVVLDEVETYLENEAKQHSEWLSAKAPPTPKATPSEQQKESVPTLDGSIGDTEAPQELTDQERFKLALEELSKTE